MSRKIRIRVPVVSLTLLLAGFGGLTVLPAVSVTASDGTAIGHNLVLAGDGTAIGFGKDVVDGDGGAIGFGRHVVDSDGSAVGFGRH